MPQATWDGKVFPLLPRLTLVAACLVLAGTGMLPTGSATPEDPDCTNPPRHEDLQHPLKEEFYLYLPEGQSDRAKFGWWKDTNRRPGLQTEECEFEDTLVYKADTKTDVLLP